MGIGVGYIAACATLFSWTIGTFAFTRASQLVNPASVNRVRLLYAFIALSCIVMVMNSYSPINLFTTISVEQYFWFGLSGFIGLTLGDYFAFTAYRILGGRRTSLFGCFAPGAALMAANLLIGEHINFIGIVGMSVSVFGIMLLVLSRKEKTQSKVADKAEYTKGILFGALGAICQGVGLVLAKKGFSISGDGFSPIYATWIRMFLASVCVYIIGAFTTNLWTEFKLVSTTIKNLKPILLGTLFGPIIGVSSSLLTATYLEASVAQTLFSLLPVSVLFASVIFFKEKVPFQSYLAVLVSIIGVLILVWRNQF
ncbi:MAG: hypothetical protein CFE21_12795 [Bacteroidetes bacterium B1(2017)]|nr:MAG: hypothetical protein CFE21_12795 [Bacteroidetes bacterium B1(2017)]